MKRLILSAAAAAALSASATVSFWGDAWGDIGFGLNAHPSGGESVAFGDYAGYGAQGAWRSAFLGSYAGSGSAQAWKSVYLGDEAGLSARSHSGVVAIGSGACAFAAGLTNVVAIGTSAFAGWNAIADATWINGQLYIGKGDGIFLTDDPALQFADAPLFYTNGCWTVRGDVHVVGEMKRVEPATGGFVDPLGAWAGEFDYYVDARIGNDGNSGLLGHPCATITGVVGRITAALDNAETTNEFPTVCVMPGSYDYPGELPSIGITFVAVSGRDATFIEPSSSNACRQINVNPDGAYYLPTFKGFTFRGFNASRAYGVRNSSDYWWQFGSFVLVAFEDCAFEDAEFFVVGIHTATTYCFIFAGCILSRCEVRPTVHFRSIQWGISNPGITDCFWASEFYDCVLRLGEDAGGTPTSRMSITGEPMTSHGLATDCYFANTYAEKPKTAASYVARFRAGGTTVTGRAVCATNSTFRVVQIINSLNLYQSDKNAIVNSIFSAGSYEGGFIGTSWYPAYGAAPFGDDLRPVDDSKRFYGYGSGADRRLRNAILADVADALTNEGYPSNVVMRLLAKRQPVAMSVAPPERPTFAMANWDSFRPPDPDDEVIDDEENEGE